MKRLIFGMILLVVGFLFFNKFITDYRKQLPVVKEQQRLKEEDRYCEEITYALNYPELKEEDFKMVKYHLSKLPIEKQKQFEDIIELKSLVLQFRKAEDLIARASALQNSIKPIPEPTQTVPVETYETEPPPPPKPVELHPFVEEMVNEIVKLYADLKKRVDVLEERQDDPEFNFLLNYTKGVIYFRHTQFFAKPDNVKELFDRTVKYFKVALRNKPDDLNTIINVELLIKNKNQMLSTAQQPGMRRQQMLVPRGAGLGTSIGI